MQPKAKVCLLNVLLSAWQLLSDPIQTNVDISLCALQNEAGEIILDCKMHFIFMHSSDAHRVTRLKYKINLISLFVLMAIFQVDLG